MPISEYLGRLRGKVGHERLRMPSVTSIVFDDARRILLVRPTCILGVFGGPEFLVRHSNGDEVVSACYSWGKLAAGRLAGRCTPRIASASR